MIAYIASKLTVLDCHGRGLRHVPRIVVSEKIAGKPNRTITGTESDLRSNPYKLVEYRSGILEIGKVEVFSTLPEAKALIEQWRRHYNAIRPHSSLGYRPPAPETILPPASALPYAALRCAPASPNAGYERPESNVTLGIATWGRPP